MPMTPVHDGTMSARRDRELLRRATRHGARVGLAVRGEDVGVLADDGEHLRAPVGERLAPVQ